MRLSSALKSHANSP
jgi:hypothetical protein